MAYLFQSARLGFRNWLPEDIPKMSKINADPEVMRFFPDVLSEGETREFIERMQRQFTEKGFCYFAVNHLENQELIGFTGLSEKTFEADFTPCIDIGWRLARKEWNKGFATEGAKRCLEYAFTQLNLKQVLAIAPAINISSERVMQKVGMRRVKTFKHPQLANDKRLERCVLYEISASFRSRPDVPELS